MTYIIIAIRPNASNAILLLLASSVSFILVRKNTYPAKELKIQNPKSKSNQEIDQTDKTTLPLSEAGSKGKESVVETEAAGI